MCLVTHEALGISVEKKGLIQQRSIPLGVFILWCSVPLGVDFMVFIAPREVYLCVQYFSIHCLVYRGVRILLKV